ncbi:fructose-bisphosphate aldolase 3, chloroplastic-like [Rutidosis leptorrhynchoides]|uniref:fructose-bisphosphate aldolase 3, chloroplastic-like n=1 Tax=Rutidosis leptorrhynchoides TaxID=125765 RepID=UPI003A99B251
MDQLSPSNHKATPGQTAPMLQREPATNAERQTPTAAHFWRLWWRLWRHKAECRHVIHDGLDGLASRSAEYYTQGARFAKWRTVVSIPCGPSALAVKVAAWGLARYAAISQDNGLVPIVEPEILLDGDYSIDTTLEVDERVWSEVFYYLAENNVMFEGILLKPSMVTPGADHKEKADAETIAKYTLTMLKRRRVPPAVPSIMFLSGGQSEMEVALNLHAMNQSPNPWHVSFSYARALQNSVLKAWQGGPENVEAGQRALLTRAKANSLAQLGKYSAEGESEDAKK